MGKKGVVFVIFLSALSLCIPLLSSFAMAGTCSCAADYCAEGEFARKAYNPDTQVCRSCTCEPSSLDLATCQKKGGMYCASDAAGNAARCIFPDQPATTCFITQSQNINTSNPYQNTYYFTDLTILSNKIISFRYEGNTNPSYEIPEDRFFGGNSGNGGRGDDGGNRGNPQDAITEYGVGGTVGKKGLLGRSRQSDEYPGAPATSVGAIIYLVVTGRLELQAQSNITVNGHNASDAEECNYCQRNGGKEGCPGASGAGGSGAGILEIFVGAGGISGSGSLKANGGHGSDGGDGTGDNGECGHDEGDDGGGGGGGGGSGSGGIIKIYTLPEYTSTVTSQLNSVTLQCASGSPGLGGDHGGNGGGDGQTGLLGSEGDCEPVALVAEYTETNGNTFLKGRNACFDTPTSNDGDLFIDFEDADCYRATEYGWSSNGILRSFPNTGTKTGPEWWNPLSKTGYDGICGDDLLLNGDFELPRGSNE